MRDSWFISVPAWGSRCISSFRHFGLPSIVNALDCAGAKARFLIHTDEEQKLRSAMSGLDAVFRPVPQAVSIHHSLGAAHREAIEVAPDGARIVLLCADMVVSRECFAAMDRRLAEGKKLIMVAATRTLGGRPPIRARSRELIEWTLRHKHPIIEQCFWGDGKSSSPWAVYFRKGESVVLRAFHLHPLVAIKDRKIAFHGTTIDQDMAGVYGRREIHVVRDPDEMSCAELSPLERGATFKPMARPMDVDSIARWAWKRTIDLHEWFFLDNPIRLCGSGDCGEQSICNAVVAKLKEMKRVSA